MKLSASFDILVFSISRTGDKQSWWKQRSTYPPCTGCSSTLCSLLLCSWLGGSTFYQTEKIKSTSCSRATSNNWSYGTACRVNVHPISDQRSTSTKMALVNNVNIFVYSLVCCVFDASTGWLSNRIPRSWGFAWRRKIFQLHRRRNGKVYIQSNITGVNIAYLALKR